jgi:hypothetical protein
VVLFVVSELALGAALVVVIGTGAVCADVICAMIECMRSVGYYM